MSHPVTIARSRQSYIEESPGCLPGVVHRLLLAPPGEGDEEAWEAFVAAYSGLLLAVASRFGAEYDGVLDRYAYLLEELRRDDCRRLRRFVADGRGRFSGWLSVVARRLCLDHYRRRYGRSRGEAGHPDRRLCRRRLADLAGTLDDPTSLIDAAAPDAEAHIDAEHRREALAAAVSRLGTADRLLLQLRFHQDLTAREIARVVGLPTPFHVYRRLTLVCRHLRTALAPPGRGRAVRDGQPALANLTTLGRT